MKNTKLRGVFIGGTSLGGTYRVFLNLKRGLANFGHELHLESCAEFEASGLESHVAAQQVVDRVRAYDYAIVNVFMSIAQMNIARYLPSSFPRVLIVHNITHATYQAARSLRDYVNSTIGVSERIREDLVERLGFCENDTFHIYNSVDPGSIADWRVPRPNNSVLSLGRLEDSSKGIFDLPRIFNNEIAAHAKLSIAGSGPDSARLQELFSNLGIEPIWLGPVQPADVAHTFRNHSIFLFPSRFEGMGLALAEAMANGLVPIASNISGITDRMIVHGESGYLYEQKNVAAAARHLTELLKDDALLQRMREGAAARAQHLFSEMTIASQYDQLIRRAIGSGKEFKSLECTDWSIPYRMGPGVRGLLPAGIRRWLAARLRL